MKPLNEREQAFREACEQYKGQFRPEMIEEFTEYWTEPNKSGTKMKWELEKTWDLKRRLYRWANNGFWTKSAQSRSPILEQPKLPTTDIEMLQELLEKYRAHPSEFTLADFAKWATPMRKMGLLCEMTKEMAAEFMRIYCGNKEKCLAAWVQRTFDAMVMSGKNFEL